MTIVFLKCGAAAASAAIGFIATSIVPPAAIAQSAEPASCATAYFTALGDLRTAKGDDLANAVSNLRASDAALPGRWLYAQTLFPKPGAKRVAEPERPCLEKVRAAGRTRCVRYDEAVPTPMPTELMIGPAPNAEELRTLKALNDLVEGRGAVPEVGNNGRYTWLAQRATGDLKTYISQPSHPALCAGGNEVAEFYGSTLRQLQKRIDEVADLAKKARTLALARVSEALTAANGSAPPPAAPAPTASLNELIALTVKAAAPQATTVELEAERTTLGALQRAKPLLIEAQVAAQKGDDPAVRDRILAAGRAVRMLEAAAYGEIYVARYRKFAGAVLSLPQEIQQAHKRTCTCAN